MPLTLRNMKEELRCKFILHVEAFCSSLRSLYTYSIANGQWCWPDWHLAQRRQKCHSRWTDQLLPATGTRAQLLPQETVFWFPLQGGKGTHLSLPSPHHSPPILCSLKHFQLPLALSLVWFACSISRPKYQVGVFHPLVATI